MTIIKLSKEGGTPLVSSIYLERFEHWKHFAPKAARLWQKRYKSLGSLTYDDLVQYANIGLWTVVHKERYDTHENLAAYVFSYASGYITHAVHRKSRMVKPPYSAIKDGTALGHASFEIIPETAGNLPPEEFPDDCLEFINQLSNKELQMYNATGKLTLQNQLKFEELNAKYS